MKQRFCGTYLAFMIQLATILHHYHLFKLEKTLFECFFGGQVFYAKKKHVFFEKNTNVFFRIASLVGTLRYYSPDAHFYNMVCVRVFLLFWELNEVQMHCMGSSRIERQFPVVKSCYSIIGLVKILIIVFNQLFSCSKLNNFAICFLYCSFRRNFLTRSSNGAGLHSNC